MNIQGVQFYTMLVKCSLHALHSRAGKFNINIKIAQLRPMIYLTFFVLQVQKYSFYDKLPSDPVLHFCLVPLHICFI